MTKVPDLTAIPTLEAAGILYVYSPANPSTPDRKITVANLRGIDVAETLTNKQIGIPATPSKLYGQLVQLTGAKLTAIYQATGNLVVPALTTNTESDISFTVTGAAVGDNVRVSPTAAPAAELAITAAWVSAADTIKVRVRNLAAGSYAGGNLPIVALVMRSAAPD